MRLLISAGGTAGGVYPALAVVHALSGQADVLWIGGQGGIEGQLVPRAGLRLESIPAAGVHGVGPAALPGNLWQLARGVRAASQLVRDFTPQAMLLTGGYVGVPVALAGRRIPTVAYVPDLQPGLALRLIARFADTVAVTAPEARQDYGRKRVVVTGYPTRPELRPLPKPEARRQLGLDPERAVVLAFGGSLGAHSINQAIWHTLPGLLDLAQVVHLTGELDWPQVARIQAELPERLQARYHPYGYLHEPMGLALASADLVVSRAGASVLGEYPLFGLPAVLVPYPHAWRYQEINADYLVARGGAVRLDDSSLARDLLPEVRGLLQDRDRLESKAEAMRGLARPRAAEAIAAELMRAA